MKEKRIRSAWTVTAVVLVLSLVLPWTVLAKVWTDLEDYSPGDIVTIHGDNSDGAGYLEGETVHVAVSGPNGYTAACDAVADTAGAWSCEVMLWPDYLAVGTYNYAATGSTSHVTQSGTFTDGNLKFHETGLPSGTNWAVTWNDVSQTVAAPTDIVYGGQELTADYSVASPLAGGSGVQYVASPVSGTATRPQNGNTTVNISFATQYQVSFEVSPSGGGSTSPSATAYYNAGSTISISATPATGYAFSSWSASGSISFASASSASTTATINGTGTITANFSASCTAPSISVQPASQTKTVGESVSFSVTASGTAPLSYQWRKGGSSIGGATGSSYSIASVLASDAGSYDVVVSNACGSATSNAATLTVNKATPVITWSNPSDIVYGTVLSASQLNATASVPGNFVYTPPAGTILNAGASQTLHVDFTPTDTANYNNASKDVTINVLKKDASVTADNKSKTYGDDNPMLTATVVGEVVGGDAINYSLSTTAGKFSNVGSYPIEVTLGANPNYNVTETDGTLTINKKDASVTADNKSKTYGDDNPTLTATVVGEVAGGAAINYSLSTTAGKFSDVGDYPIVVTLDSNPNYNVTKTNGTLTINKATLTVTADNKSKYFADPDPAFTFQYSGFKGSDGPTDIDVAPTCGVSGLHDAVGTYAIVCSGGSDNNYTFSYANGTLTVLAWSLNGFFQPVDMGGVWNTVKGGSTVPLKFEVFKGSTELTDVSVVKGFTAIPVACPLSAYATDAIEFVTTGGTVLRYDFTAGQFIQNWQTPRKPGLCVQVTMTTQDGSTLAANFKLK
jgi:hypothetical protein